MTAEPAEPEPSGAAPPHGRTARLYALIARERRVAVVLRRGPSKQVRLIGWNMARDTFEPGQWLKARVYERRCDLSPDGTLLCYFAASHRPPLASWTAISRPPWFTALALWRKGDGWGGGGLFDSKIRLALNHRPTPYRPGIDETALADGFRLPKRFLVRPLGEHAGWGEDDPICWHRMTRDGWAYLSHGGEGRWDSKGPLRVSYDAPVVMQKQLGGRDRALGLWLRLEEHGRFERDGRSYLSRASIVGRAGEVVHDLGRVDWADLDHTGDVLWAWAGRLWRLPLQRRTGRLGGARLLGDFNAMRFERIEPPAEARRW